jgi:hypothetical protein
MELIAKGNKQPQIFEGNCRECGARYRAIRMELRVERCPREHYEFAHADCSECSTTDNVILYPIRS